MLQAIKEQIARQLNDHEDSPRGVEQSTYYVWTEPHIDSALETVMSYLYSIKPDLFAEQNCMPQPDTSCVVNLKGVCGNVLKLLGVGTPCDNIIERDIDQNDLSYLLTPICAFGVDGNQSSLNYEVKHISEGIYQFTKPIESGTVIHFICSRYMNIHNAPDIIFKEYHILFVSMACWLLLLTDNESRSNIERANLYFQQVQSFTSLKLQIEFSLWAKDYQDGKRLTPEQELTR